MIKNNNLDIGMRISVALLKHRGKITEDEIEAIPFVSEMEADLIINRLIESFDVEVITEKIRNKPFLEWTKIIRLKKEK